MSAVGEGRVRDVIDGGHLAESDRAPTLVTTKVAARILKIHPETLREWVREGRYEIPKPIRVGSRFRWELDELRAYVKSRQMSA